MSKNRLEAFSDGVMAIIITIMVLELRMPEGSEFSDLVVVAPQFIGYVLSFVFLAIYWANHHHLLQTLDKVTGAILWSNLHLLFWLSLVPFLTGWMAISHSDSVPLACYGLDLLMAAIAYWILQNRILASQDSDSLLRKVIGRDIKGKISPILYAIALLVVFRLPQVSLGIFILVALIWLVPDRRIERLHTHPDD